MQFADKIQKVLADQEGRDAVRKKLREEPIDFSAGYAQIEAFAKNKRETARKTTRTGDKIFPVPAFL